MRGVMEMLSGGERCGVTRLSGGTTAVPLAQMSGGPYRHIHRQSVSTCTPVNDLVHTDSLPDA